jgi:hypothetical protein
MKRMFSIFVFAILIASFISISGYSATVSDCAVITEDTTLTADIVDATDMFCINIGTDNVVFDCQGFTVDSDDSTIAAGIRVSGDMF